MTDLPAPRKPRRLGLYLPFALALLVAVAWTAGWIWIRGEAHTRMDRQVEALRAAGYDISWKERSIGGYPFRFDITLTDARVREPSGWALETPKLEAEARMNSPDSWIMAAPDGLIFTRPVGGPVQVKGRILRASLTHFSEVPPRFSFEGLGLTFQPAPGAQPFALTSAERVEFHLRGNKAIDEGMVSATVEGAKARPDGLFGRVAGNGPVAMNWTATLTKIAAFSGKDWPDAVRNWTRAGGKMNLRQAGVTAGDAILGANAGALTVDSTGRLNGVLDVTLKQAPRALAVMGEMGAVPAEQAGAASAVAAAHEGTGDTATARIHFEAGRTTLGPVALGESPLVYRP